MTRTRNRSRMLDLCAALAFVVSISSGARTHAQYNGAVAAGTAAGVAAASASSSTPLPVGDQLPGQELEDWVDPRAATSARSTQGCGGISAEATLSGTSTHTFVTLTLLNETGGPLTFLADQVHVHLANHKSRRLLGAGPVKLEHDWQLTRTLAFPDKEMLKGQDQLDLELRVLPDAPARDAEICVLGLRFTRNKAMPQPERTYVSYTTLDLEFGVGPRFFDAGGLEELSGGSGLSLHLDFSGFFGVHHGMSVSLVGDFYGDDEVSRVAPNLVLDDNATISGTGFLLGYIGRLYLTSWLTLAYNIATGPYIFQLTDSSDDGVHITTVVFPLRERLRIAADLFQLDDGSRFSIAASLVHLFVPYGEVGTVEARGNSLAATFELMIGN